MSPQEVFDKIVTHLRNQNCKSVGPSFTICRYRGLGNRKCAVGIMIDDSEYESWMDNTNGSNGGGNISQLLGSLQTRNEALFTRLQPHRQLLIQMQLVHDTFETNQWENQIMVVAKDFNLIYTPPGV